jgi:hypothetical protein
MDRPWGMIEVSIFSFSIFGEFSELLVNSILLSAFQYAASKKSVLTDPNFFSPTNHNSIQVHMVHEHFLSINLVLTAVKLFNIGNLTLFSSQFTCRE